MAEKAKPIYAPIPARAMLDSRLKERHLRTLMVIAAHDRLGRNGAGCWASNKRLADLVGCDYTRLSANLTDLGTWGYIERVKHPLNKTLRVLKVLYTDEDGATMKGVKAGADSLPTGKDGPPDSLPDEKPNPAENCRKPDSNIFRETGNISSRSYEIHSPEGASPGGDDGSPGGVLVEGLSVDGRDLRVFASLWRDNPQNEIDTDSLHRWQARLEQIAESHSRTPRGEHAARLVGEIETELWERAEQSCDPWKNPIDIN